MITSVEEFVKLRTSDNPEEYQRAIHDSVQNDVWFELLDRQPDMLFWLVQNKTVPLAILDRISDNSDPSIRRAVARKRKLSSEIFTKLACDPDEYVRHTIAVNPKVPQHILRLLSSDISPMVSESAKQRLSQP